jgi:branched-subunit amino acid ABC-type transport system permease component
MARPTYVRGEILPPLSQTTGITEQTSDEHLNLIASWLDDRFVVPGTAIRFGLDALIGWIPGIGDAIAAFASLFIIWAGWKRGAARITLIRMLLNLTLEATFGSIPIIGDFAHVAWKANRRNYNLLIRDQHAPRWHKWLDLLFVAAASLMICLLFLAPFLLLIYLLKWHRPLY